MPLNHNMPESSRKAIQVLTGIEVPTADPLAMRATAEIYEVVGNRLRGELTELMELTRKRVRSNFGGRAAEFYDRSLDQFTKGENDYLGGAAETAYTLVREMRRGAANAEYMAAMVIGQLVQLLVEIAWAIATAKFTFGASLKLIPVFKAIRSLAMRRILAWFLLTVPGHQIVSQLFASLDSIIQRMQIANGTRDTWDHDLTKGAHVGAVFEGLVSAGLSAGVSGLFDNQLKNVFKTHLDNLRAVPDPRPDPVPAPKVGAGPDPRADPLPDPVPPPKPDPGPVPPPKAAPEPDPVNVPGQRDGDGAPSLNKDLAELFGRHNDEMLFPFGGNSPPGAKAWGNSASAAGLRNDVSDLFEKHFGHLVGPAAARRLGDDYAEALIRNWSGPDLPKSLSKALGDSLPAHVRNHLADTPAGLRSALHSHNARGGVYAQRLGAGAGSGALEGYLGEGAGNAALGEGWKASVWSATAGASQATTQSVTTDVTLRGMDALRNPPVLPEAEEPLPRTETAPPSPSPSDGTVPTNAPGREADQDPRGGDTPSGGDGGGPRGGGGADRDPRGDGDSDRREPGTDPGTGADSTTAVGGATPDPRDGQDPTRNGTEGDDEPRANADTAPASTTAPATSRDAPPGGTAPGSAGQQDEGSAADRAWSSGNILNTPTGADAGPPPYAADAPPPAYSAYGLLDALGLGDGKSGLPLPGVKGGFPFTAAPVPVPDWITAPQVFSVNEIVLDDPAAAQAAVTEALADRGASGNGGSPGQPGGSSDQAGDSPDRGEDPTTGTTTRSGGDERSGDDLPPPYTGPPVRTVGGDAQPGGPLTGTPAQEERTGPPAPGTEPVAADPNPSPDETPLTDAPSGGHTGERQGPPGDGHRDTKAEEGTAAPSPVTERAEDPAVEHREQPSAPAVPPATAVPPVAAPAHPPADNPASGDGQPRARPTREPSPPRDGERRAPGTPGEEAPAPSTSSDGSPSPVSEPAPAPARNEASTATDVRGTLPGDDAATGGGPASAGVENGPNVPRTSTESSGDVSRSDEGGDPAGSTHAPRVPEDPPQKESADDRGDDSQGTDDQTDDQGSDGSGSGAERGTRTGSEEGSAPLGDDGPPPPPPPSDQSPPPPPGGQRTGDGSGTEGDTGAGTGSGDENGGVRPPAGNQDEGGRGETPNGDGPGEGADRRDGQESSQDNRPPLPAPPPGSPVPHPYQGSFRADPDSPSYDLSYLLTSSLLTSSMVHAEHMHPFVNDTLNAHNVEAETVDAVHADIAAQARRDMSGFFTPEGFRTTVTRPDGSTWQATLRMRPLLNDFRHVPSDRAGGPAAPETKLVDEAGESNPAEGSRGYGGNKYVGFGFQVSPLLLGTTGAGDVGPRFFLRGFGGTRQRATGQTTSTLSDGYTSYEIKGKPELYASDLVLDFDMRPVAAPEGVRGGDHVRGQAFSGDGLVLTLPGKVVGHGVPGRFEVTDPFAPAGPEQNGREGNGRQDRAPEQDRSADGTASRDTRDGDTRETDGETGNRRAEGERSGGSPASDHTGATRVPPSPHAGNNHPISVSPVLPSDQNGPHADKTLPDWIREYLWPAEKHRTWWSFRESAVPGSKERHRKRVESFNDQVTEKFGDKSLRNNLPKMTNGPAVFTVTDPGGDVRMVSITSVPVSYTPKDHGIPPGKYIKGNKTERESGTSLRHSDFLGFTAGAGVSVDTGQAGGTHKVRVDAAALEGGVRGRSTNESTRSSSGSVNRMNYGKAPASAYEVERNYYVHFDGDPGTYRFHGSSVEILNDEEVRVMKGESPSDKTPPRLAPIPEEAPPPQPDPTTTSGDRNTPTGSPDPAPPTGATPDSDGSHGGDGTRNSDGDGDGAQSGTAPRDGNGTRAENGGPALRPPRPNLTGDHPVSLHGATPREFTWPDGSQYRQFGEHQRNVYQEVAYRVLRELANKRPGMVLPELARSREDYARRPGRPNEGLFSHSPREFRPFRRDHDVAVFNTHRVMDAISAAGFKSGVDDMAHLGLTIHLVESNRFSPSSLFKGGRDTIRPPFVTVRVNADFGALRHAGDTARGTGGEYTGAAERTSGSGSQIRKTGRFTSGLYARRSDALDSGGAPKDGGVVAATLQYNSSKGDGRGIGVKTASEEVVQYPEGSSVWNSDVRISARFYDESNDLGMTSSDTPLRERGTDLLNEPIQALATMDTAKAVPDGGQRPNGAPSAPAPGIRAITPDRAREIIEAHTRPDPESVRRTRDPGAPFRRSGNGNAPQGPRGEQNTRNDQDSPGDRGTRDNQPPANAPVGQRTAPPGPGQRNTTDGRTGEHTSPVPEGGQRQGDQSPPAPTGERGGSDPAPTGGNDAPVTGTDGDRRGERPGSAIQRRRDQVIRDLPTTVENVNTRIPTGPDGRESSLTEVVYSALSGAEPGQPGSSRGLRTFLTSGQGGAQFFPNLLSPENLAGNPALNSSGGVRARIETDSGWYSPFTHRVTTATRFLLDSVDHFERVKGAIVWKDKRSADVSAKTGRRKNLDFLLSGAGRGNPNPVQPPTDGTDPGPGQPPNSANRPTLQAGPAVGRSLFDRFTNNKLTNRFTEALEFHPKIEMSYFYSASGYVTQAVERLRSWSLGPTFPRSPRYEGLEAYVKDLVSGLIHIRDVHQKGLVEDRVTVDADGDLTGSVQPHPKDPSDVTLRPGFEDSGKLLQPANPDQALRDLANDLAGQGWELTRDSRESLLHALTTHLGLTPNTGTPIPVKVRAIDHSIGHMNAPTSAPLSLDATVTVNLDRSGTRIEYLSNTEYRQKQGWEDSDRNQEGRESSSSSNAQGSILQPLPRSGGDQAGNPDPSSRPYRMDMQGGVSASASDNRSDSVRDTDKRSVGLTILETPYAKVSMDTRLRVDLHISESQGFANTALGETPGSNGRRDFSGTGDSGRVEGLYPTPYLDFGRGEAPGTDTTVTEGGTPDPGGPAPTQSTGEASGPLAGSPGNRPVNTASPDGDTARDPNPADTGSPRPNGASQSPERPLTGSFASLEDLMRTWGRDHAPPQGVDVSDTVMMPVALENGGQSVRDTAGIVLAKSLGWAPADGSVRDGRYTPEAVNAARDHVTGKLKLNTRNNTLDQNLNGLALKALFLESDSPEGTELLDLGRTTWSVRAVPDPTTAKILDYNPNIRLVDSSESGRTFSPGHDQSFTTGTGGEARPSGRTGTGPPVTGTHYGGVNGQGSSTSGGDTARGSKPKEPPHSERVRTGPGYLVEMDTTWVIAAHSRPDPNWFVRKARSAGHTISQGTRSAVGKVRGAFGRPGPAPSSPATPPGRWQAGEASEKTTVWITHEDAVRLGIVPPDGTPELNSLTSDYAKAHKNFKDAEKDYLKTRYDLAPAADAWRAAPEDQGAAQRYRDLESQYLAALSKFDEAIAAWEEKTKALRDGLDASRGSARPRTQSDTTAGTPAPNRENGTGTRDAPGSRTARVQRGTGDPAADPDAVELDQRNAAASGQPATADTSGAPPRGNVSSLVEKFRSELNVKPRESAPAPVAPETVKDPEPVTAPETGPAPRPEAAPDDRPDPLPEKKPHAVPTEEPGPAPDRKPQTIPGGAPEASPDKEPGLVEGSGPGPDKGKGKGKEVLREEKTPGPTDDGEGRDPSDDDDPDMVFRMWAVLSGDARLGESSAAPEARQRIQRFYGADAPSGTGGSHGEAPDLRPASPAPRPEEADGAPGPSRAPVSDIPRTASGEGPNSEPVPEGDAARAPEAATPEKAREESAPSRERPEGGSGASRQRSGDGEASQKDSVAEDAKEKDTEEESTEDAPANGNGHRDRDDPGSGDGLGAGRSGEQGGDRSGVHRGSDDGRGSGESRPGSRENGGGGRSARGGDQSGTNTSRGEQSAGQGSSDSGDGVSPHDPPGIPAGERADGPSSDVPPSDAALPDAAPTGAPRSTTPPADTPVSSAPRADTSSSEAPPANTASAEAPPSEAPSNTPLADAPPSDAPLPRPLWERGNNPLTELAPASAPGPNTPAPLALATATGDGSGSSAEAVPEPDTRPVIEALGLTGSSEGDPRFPHDLTDGRILGTVDESRVTRDGNGRIATVDGRRLKDFLHELLTKRAAEIRTIFENKQKVRVERSTFHSHLYPSKKKQSRFLDVTLSPADLGKENGAVNAVVIDRVTGTVAEGLNGRAGHSLIPEHRLHPLIRERIERMRKENGYRLYDRSGKPILVPGGTTQQTSHYPHPDTPTRHAEIKALNRLLRERAGAKITDFQLDTVFTLKNGALALRCPCCGNCTRITKGAPAWRAGKLRHPPGYPVDEGHLSSDDGYESTESEPDSSDDEDLFDDESGKGRDDRPGGRPQDPPGNEPGKGGEDQPGEEAQDPSRNEPGNTDESSRPH
ncbi:YwqJ-related putative deaminase [Nocardiopsis sp. FR6]|uniref:YwqJ-related putative deaminase n=1 Tax=Nocardiopsis sp. FR6 TaxID=2605986 RepID=UPI00135A5096|nr:YwqJ-related putative deaminase [Nocardiopsis sp. FR6]